MPVSEPPALIENDIVECTIQGQLCGQTILTVLHYRFDVVTTGALDSLYPDLAAAINRVIGIRGKYVAAAAANYSMDAIVVQAIHPTRFVRWVTPVDFTGLMAEDALTADLAAVINRQSWFVLQRTLPLHRGMWSTLHYAPVPSDKEEEGLIDEAYRTGELDSLKLSLLETLVTDLGNEFVPVIYHRGGIAPHYTDIVAADVKPEIRVMRRRTVGRGI